MTLRRYELTNEQWEQIKGFFPPYSTGRPPKRSNREMFNAILWIARSGAPWRDLPDHYGLWKTVYARFCKWRNEGVLLTIFQELNAEPDFENLSIVSVPKKGHKS
ncbi:transposase [Bacillus thuringiensis]|uniref:transposase n=1 Tax=Bacillus thuringiensis TaxID=1428 RepID=UPI00403C29A2